MDTFPQRYTDDMNVVNCGFINYHHWLKAQMTEEYTECDTSYIIICLPNKLS